MTLSYFERANIRRVVVVAKPTYVRVWEKEIAELLPDPNACNTLVLPGAGTIAKQADMLARWDLRPGINVCITHYDAYWREPLATALLKWKPPAIVMDEIHAIKHRNSQRSKYAHLLAKQKWLAHRLGLTGTPTGTKIELALTPQARLFHLFSIMGFIDPEMFGTRWRLFEDTYCVMSQNPRLPVPIITGYKRTDELVAKVRSRVFVINKGDLPQRPPIIDVAVPIDLTPSTRRHYEELKKFSISKLEGLEESGEPVEGYVVSKLAINLAFKLQQVCCGSVITDKKAVIDTSDEKLMACMAVIEDSIDNTNVVVGCRFRRNVRRVAEACTRAGYTTVVIMGGISKAERDAALDTFATQDNVVLVCNIHSTAEGINDLVVCNVAIVYSCDLEPEAMIQWRGRYDRPGQTREITIYHLIARNSVEEEFYEAQSTGRDLAVEMRSIKAAKRLISG